MLGIFAFGSLLAFTIAHASMIALRFREPCPAAAVPGAVLGPVGGGLGAAARGAGRRDGGRGLDPVLVLHEGARIVGGLWLAFGRGASTSSTAAGRTSRCASASRSPSSALQHGPEVEYGSILVPVFGGPLDDDIVGTAGRLASDESDDTRAAR